MWIIVYNSLTDEARGGAFILDSVFVFHLLSSVPSMYPISSSSSSWK